MAETELKGQENQNLLKELTELEQHPMITALEKTCASCGKKFLSESGDKCSEHEEKDKLHSIGGKVALERICIVCHCKFIPERGLQEKCDDHDDGVDPDDIEDLQEMSQKSMQSQIEHSMFTRMIR